MAKEKKALLEEVLTARAIVDKLEDKLSLAKDVKDSAQAQLIEVMDEADEKSVKIITSFGVRNVARTETLYASVNKEDQEEMIRWVDEDCGRNDMIKQSVHASTLTGFINRRIDKGDHVPSFIKMFFKPGLRISKSK